MYRIKPLEWIRRDAGSIKAESVVGTFYVACQRSWDGSCAAWCSRLGWLQYFKAVEDAKIAAEELYRAELAKWLEEVK